MSSTSDDSKILVEQKAYEGLVDESAKLKARLSRMKDEISAIHTHLETPIVMRTGFTGDEPYAGWKGLGQALREALDERDFLRQLCEQQQETINRLLSRSAEEDDTGLTREDTDAGC